MTVHSEICVMYGVCELLLLTGNNGQFGTRSEEVNSDNRGLDSKYLSSGSLNVSIGLVDLCQQRLMADHSI